MQVREGLEHAFEASRRNGGEAWGLSPRRRNGQDADGNGRREDGRHGASRSRWRRASGPAGVRVDRLGGAGGGRRGAGPGRDRLPAARRPAGRHHPDRRQRRGGVGAAHPRRPRRAGAGRRAAGHRHARVGRRRPGQGAVRAAPVTGGGLPVRTRQPGGRGVRDRRGRLPAQTGPGGPAGRGGHPVLRRPGRRGAGGPAPAHRGPAGTGGRPAGPAPPAVPGGAPPAPARR